MRAHSQQLRARCAALAAACAAILALAIQAPSAAQESPRQRVVTSTASIRGRVLTTSGQPIRGAQVQVRSGRDDRVVTTGADGAYEVRDLLPGSWTIQASKAGYVSLQYGQPHPYAPPVPTPLADGERLIADLALMPGGAIAGQVVDAHSEPVMGAGVLVMRAQMVRGRRQLTPFPGTTDTTDDTGAFRIYGLVPGEYYVAVTLPSHASTPEMSTPGILVLYPGTRSVSEAFRLTVAAGQEQLGIVIAAPPRAPGVRVSGRVVDSTGLPAAGAAIHLYDARGDQLAGGDNGITTIVATDGRFTASDVPPGSYLLDATLTNGGPARLEHAAVPLNVGSSDITGVTLATRRAVTLRATVWPRSGEDLPDGFSIQLSADSAGLYGTLSSRLHMTGRGGASRSPLSIELAGLHGPSRLLVSELPAGWILEAIELGGRDVTDAEVDFATLEGVVDARIVVTDRSTVVTGRVTQDGTPRRGSVVVFPEDPQHWGYPSRLVRTANVGEDGRFEIPDLPPGERYRAVALAFVEAGEHHDPAFLERLKSAGTSFDAVANDTVTLALDLVGR